MNPPPSVNQYHTVQPPLTPDALNPVQTISGRRMTSVWVSIHYPLTMIVNDIDSPWGPGTLFVFVTSQAELSLHGINVPRNFVEVDVGRDNLWVHVRFTYPPASPDEASNASEDVAAEDDLTLEVDEEDLVGDLNSDIDELLDYLMDDDIELNLEDL